MKQKTGTKKENVGVVWVADHLTGKGAYLLEEQRPSIRNKFNVCDPRQVVNQASPDSCTIHKNDGQSKLFRGKSGNFFGQVSQFGFVRGVHARRQADAGE